MGAKGRAFLTVVDGEEVAIPRKRTKSTRNGGVKPEVKEKFTQFAANRPPLVAMNDRQQEYINAVKTTSFVICVGVWGSSKTFIPSTIAADLLLDKKLIVSSLHVRLRAKVSQLAFLKEEKKRS